MAVEFVTMVTCAGDCKYPGSDNAPIGNWTTAAEREPTQEPSARLPVFGKSYSTHRNFEPL